MGIAVFSALSYLLNLGVSDRRWKEASSGISVLIT